MTRNPLFLLPGDAPKTAYQVRVPVSKGLCIVAPIHPLHVDYFYGVDWGVFPSEKPVALYKANINQSQMRGGMRTQSDFD
jgi:hypothetical protein